MDSDSRTRRDAVTVEISYAVITGAAIAALTYFLVVAPTVVWELNKEADDILKLAASIISFLAFSVRVTVLLFRLGEKPRKSDGRR